MSTNAHLSTGESGAPIVSGTPLTTSVTNEAAPDLLQNSLDRRIVKVRPMSTPIDQISRSASARPAGAMTVDFFSVDTKKTQTSVREAVGPVIAGDAASGDKDNGSGTMMFTLSTNSDNLFEATETLLLPEIEGKDGQPLVLYVLSRTDAGVNVTPINAPTNADGKFEVPLLDAGTTVVRMGRAAAELDVQTAQFAALPKKSSNYCQIFKMQIEQSTLQRIAEQEVGWNFSDQEEAAIIDMRLGMEKNFLFGSRAKIFDSVKNQDVYLTGGIWNQAGREFALGSRITESDLVSLCSAAFTRNAGSKQKILIAGTTLIENISRIDLSRSISASETVVKWGIEFKEIRSNFGSLLVLHSEVFDQCGHQSDGLIIDPNYVTKYVHLPFKLETLDLRKSGQRNTDAVVITEASCLVLRYPDAHVRVMG